MATPELIEAIAVTAELCGREISPAAARVMLADLSPYPEPQVLGALTRCRREVKGGLTIHDVVSRIDDGRPGAEEAWALMPFSESDSVVWTDEMAKAFGVARGLVESGEKVAARMAFKEAYDRMVSRARNSGVPVSWSPSLGHDWRGRDAVIADAVAKGRLTYEHAQSICPALPPPNRDILALAGGAVLPQLPNAA